MSEEETPNMEKLTIHEAFKLPDGSGFATASMPLPKDHWLYAEGPNVPPMPFRLGTDDPRHASFVEAVWAASRYAVRASTRNGQDADFDPDALAMNMVVGLLGYHTPDGLSGEGWDDPSPVPPVLDSPRP